MIDWPSLARIIPTFGNQLVGNNSDDIELAINTWRSFISDAKQSSADTHVRWVETPGAQLKVKPQQHPYTVIGIDGSQIYPDRHEGVRCALTNTSAVTFTYGENHSTYVASTIPKLIVPQKLIGFDETSIIVDTLRHEHELSYGLEKAKFLPIDSTTLLLFDGALMFWHLLSLGATRNTYLRFCMQILEQLHEQRIVVAWYTSLPNSTQLISFLRTLSGQSFENIVDADFMMRALSTSCRCPLFEPTHPLAQEYPAHLRPIATYLHNGSEIGRVELPAWIAHDPILNTRCLAIILDQCNKGAGYPICLAHAHERAIVTPQDRRRFFTLIEQTLGAQGTHKAISRKQNSKKQLRV